MTAKSHALRSAKANGYTVRINHDTPAMLDVGLEAPNGHRVGLRDVHESIFNTEFEGGPTDTADALWKSVERDASNPPEKCDDPECDWCTST